MPVPVSETVREVSSGSLVVRVTVADCSPTDVGLNVTPTPWLLFAVIVNVVGERVNAAFDDVTLDTVKSALPLLETTSVSVFSVFVSTSPKLNVLADRLMSGAVPIVVSEILVGLPDALWIMDRVAGSAPKVVGVVVTVMIWF